MTIPTSEQARATLHAHCDRTRIDDEGSAEIALYHLFRDLLDLCDADKIDLDAVLSHARSDARDDALNDA